MSNGWYTVVEGRELQQGDIIERCPVVLPAALPCPPTQEALAAEGAVEYEISLKRAVVLSQSCDLVEGQGKQKINHVVLCPVTTFDEIDKLASEHPLKNKGMRSKVAKNEHGAYFAVEGFDDEQGGALTREPGFVLLPELFLLPLSYVRSLAEVGGRRLRIASPNREALSRKFGDWFSRVALAGPVILPEK